LNAKIRYLLTVRSSSNATYTSFADAMLPHTQNTYWHEFNELSKHNIQLNYFERLWAAWYAFMGNDVLATGIMSFVMHEVVYFGRSLPWIIIDKTPAFNKYKIQNVSLTNIPSNGGIVLGRSLTCPF
jgi:methylsterol monooxygenase